jgi:hypothetical protein
VIENRDLMTCQVGILSGSTTWIRSIPADGGKSGGFFPPSVSHFL